MNAYRTFIRLVVTSLYTGCILLASLSSYAGDNEPYQTPLFTSKAVPPLNMLVMGRDHKLYYEAYNDASDLNNDGVIDTGYKGYLSNTNGGIDYYGYFNSYICYSHDGDKFVPESSTTTKKCSGSHWSGDYLNYLTTSRMDALRKVLYGGYRATDSATETILQGAFIPQDAHTWGKEYYNQTNDGYLISDYTPLRQPATGYRHLFAVVSLTDGGIPQLRTLTNTSLRIWNWISKERPVAGDTCNNGSDVSCTSKGPSSSWSIVPSAHFSDLKITTWKDSANTSTSISQMDTLFNSSNSTSSNQCGTGTPGFTNINSGSNFTNPYTSNGCTQDGYHTLIEGKITPTTTGSYQFSVDGDDAVEFSINGVTSAWYGDHGAANAAGHGAVSTTLTANQSYTFNYRHEENGGGSSFFLYWTTPGADISEMTSKNIRVATCTDSFAAQDDSCGLYESGHYKPVGILHNYGVKDKDKMFFGLISGSYAKNISGGVLRSKLQSFSNEYNSATGQFCFKAGSNCATGSLNQGITYTIDQFRTIDFNYGSQSYGCGWITTKAITQSDTCYMWGNPIGEMMYETMRYLAGATSPTSEYNYTSSGKDASTPLSLPKIDTWTPPYIASGNPDGYKSCAAPVMTVISDINPSYDYKMPGSHWSNNVTTSGNPSSISGFNAATEADKIWAQEGSGSQKIFIGESNDVADSAPTPKTVNKLSTIRGLSPEEPSKQGTYYSAAVANFAANNQIGGDKKLTTYSVALASPLPTIKFPVGANTVTIVPFAKSVGGSSIVATGNFQPTDQIVDFYVETLANTDASCSTATPSTVKDCKSSINGGRPYAKFRINYEDVEQGADHDMDAIALYEILVTSDAKLTINITSEYAAGGIDQHMGYVISGTTKDGIYLEVKDQGGANIAYKLDTPEGKSAGECLSGTCDALSRLSSSRTFTPSDTLSANFLENPLWYAAKYGMPNRSPASVVGTPENYFLVTNALTLKAQLNKAFNSIVQSNNPITAPAVQPAKPATDDGSFYVYKTSYSTQNWSGNLTKESSNTVTGAKSTVWSTGASLSETPRKVKMAAAGGSLVDVNWDNLSGLSYQQIDLQTALNIDPQTNTADTLGETRLDFILGEANSDFRDRDSVVLGDIINSTPALVEGAQYVRYIADKVEQNASQPYSEWATQISDNPDTEIKEGRRAQLYVGSNDGMLHAFDAETGEEKFAFIPTAVIPNLNKLTSSDYNEVGGEHQFYVDGSPIVRDVYINDEWRTVLIGTLRAGGRSIFALDITDPDSISLLWEFSEGDDLKPSRLWDTSDEIAEDAKSDIGYSFPIPAIARLHAGLGTGSEVNEGRWAVVTGNGYDSASGRAVLFVIDIATGKFKAIPTTANATDMLNGLSSVKIADEDRDGVADYAYAGDLKGQLWRFNLLKTGTTGSLADDEVKISFSDLKVSFDSTSPSASSISPVPLFTAVDSSNKPQAITAAPSLINHPTGLGYIVMFGTGRYFQLPDKNDITSPQTLYGIWDQHTGSAENSTTTTTSLSRSNLVQQSITEQTITSFSDGAQNTTQNIRIVSNNGVTWKTEETPSGKYGWYLDLGLSTAGSFTADGERVIDEMSLRGQVLFLTTRTPHNDTCAAGLNGWTYGIDPYTGGRTRFNVFDLNHDKYVNFKDAYTVNGETFVVSGFQTAAGGFSLGGETLFSSDGSATKANYGPNSTGRQTWQALPEDE